MATSRTTQFLLTLSVGLGYVAYVNGAESIDSIATAFWEWRMTISPEFSSTIPLYAYNDKLTSYSYEDLTTRWETAKDFLQRLSVIDRSNITDAKKVSYDILKDILETFIDGYKWKDYEPLNPINFLEGWFLGTDYMFTGTPFDSEGDFINYVRRIERIPQQLDEMMNLSRMAIANGHISHNGSVSRVPDAIDAMLVDNTAMSDLYKPFIDWAGKVFAGNADAITYLEKRLNTSITQFLTKLIEVKQFLINEYMPKTRQGFGINSLPNGTENYQACLYFHTSTNYTAKEIHTIGLNEVARIERLIKQNMNSLGFSASTTISDMYQNLTSNSRFLLNTTDEAIKMFKEIIFGRIQPILPKYFKNIPNLPLEVRPYDGSGEYKGGTSDGSKPGIFFVNVNNPRDNPTYTMVSFSLHESIPGHHMAESYALLAADIPIFRRHFEWISFNAPYFFPFYNALSEGWALYSEFLGEEMGVYQNNYELLGRYRDEIFRACRLVVDTGIHHYNWSRQQAIDYLMNYTGYELVYVSDEIDRYSTWPGQATGYKIGEVKIKQLRQRANETLGSKFDLADFHYTVLRQGLMPLNLLEEIIDKWINDQLMQQGTTPSTTDCKGSINSLSYAYTKYLVWIVAIASLQIYDI